MNYTVYYHLPTRRKSILRGIPYRLELNDHAEAEDKNFVQELLQWMNQSGRRVVDVTVPTSCNACSAWSASRQSIYSPKYQRRKRKRRE